MASLFQDFRLALHVLPLPAGFSRTGNRDPAPGIDSTAIFNLQRGPQRHPRSASIPAWHATRVDSMVALRYE